MVQTSGYFCVMNAKYFVEHESTSATWIGGSDELIENVWVWYGIDQPIKYGFGIHYLSRFKQFQKPMRYKFDFKLLIYFCVEKKFSDHLLIVYKHAL